MMQTKLNGKTKKKMETGLCSCRRKSVALISPIFTPRQLSALVINTHNQSVEGWGRKCSDSG